MDWIYLHPFSTYTENSKLLPQEQGHIWVKTHWPAQNLETQSSGGAAVRSWDDIVSDKLWRPWVTLSVKVFCLVVLLL